MGRNTLMVALGSAAKPTCQACLAKMTISEKQLKELIR